MASIHYVFSINMSYSQCEELFLQPVKYLIVKSLEGKRIQLPKQNMRRFLSPAGLRGVYELQIDSNHKIQSIKKIK